MASLPSLFVALYLCPLALGVTVWLLGPRAHDVERAVTVFYVCVTEPLIYRSVAPSRSVTVTVMAETSWCAGEMPTLGVGRAEHRWGSRQMFPPSRACSLSRGYELPNASDVTPIPKSLPHNQ